ncbi:hypothetical protein EYF80_005861 [Liparis tanakae]|uniref:Uncharacterized protein n=1 Tax=Liparis tanakae TaxID=230148 RepID=A0A4Z2J139_9TELE|nr:hypothetical protein EYF80_005861 [Liparis tanakae]
MPPLSVSCDKRSASSHSLSMAPDEVSTQVTPCGLSVAAGLEVVSLALLLGELGVLGAAQDSDDPCPAQKVWHLPRADPQGVGSLQAWRSRSSMNSPQDIVSFRARLPPSSLSDRKTHDNKLSPHFGFSGSKLSITSTLYTWFNLQQIVKGNPDLTI